MNVDRSSFISHLDSKLTFAWIIGREDLDRPPLTALYANFDQIDQCLLEALMVANQFLRQKRLRALISNNEVQLRVDCQRWSQYVKLKLCAINLSLAGEHAHDEFEACGRIKRFDHLLEVTSLNELAVLDVPKETDYHVDLSDDKHENLTLRVNYQLLEQGLDKHESGRERNVQFISENALVHCDCILLQ